MLCRCINNERISKSFIVGNLYDFSVNDENGVTVNDPYTYMSIDFIDQILMHIDDFVLSFEVID